MTVVVLPVIDVIDYEFAGFLNALLNAVINVRDTQIYVHGNLPPNVCLQVIRAFNMPSCSVPDATESFESE